MITVARAEINLGHAGPAAMAMERSICDIRVINVGQLMLLDPTCSCWGSRYSRASFPSVEQTDLCFPTALAFSKYRDMRKD